jgi:hypothetical protein
VTLPAAWRKRACVVHDVPHPESWFDSVPDFKTRKRRLEWMLSRIAEQNLRRAGATGAHVSYSHSGQFGGAAVDDAPVGIDVEVVRPLSANAAHLFLSDEEAAQASTCRVPDALLHFWSAKEARWKQLGGSLLTLKRVSLTLLEERAAGLLFDYAETSRIGEIVVALTRPTS